MPDWKALVRERLGKVHSSPAVEAEIIAELAAHLEDVCDELRLKGMSESDGMDLALKEMQDPDGLSGRIRCAKGGEETMNQASMNHRAMNHRTMNHRTKTLWLPGLIILTASMGWLMILQRMTLGPGMPGPWLHAGLAFLPYLVWQLTQPLFGFAGAYLSRRAGAEPGTELAASLFPAIVMFGVWWALVACIVVTRYSHVSHQWPLVFAGALNWSILPGLSLFLGRFLFLRTQRVARS